MLKEICYCGHPKERHIADKGELNEFRRAKHFGKEANPVKTFHDCYHCVCKEYALDEQYTKQEEETVKEQFCKVCHHQILGNGMCFGCTHDCSNGYTTPTSTNIPASSTPIVEECTPGNCPYYVGGTSGWGGSPIFFQEMKARHNKYHTSNKKI